MKSNAYIILICLTSILLNPSCSKEEAPSFRRVSTELDDDGDFTSYEYDNEGRIVRITESDGDYSTFTYRGSTFIHSIYIDRELSNTLIGQLDARGWVSEVTGPNGVRYAYEFDRIGYLKRSIWQTNGNTLTVDYVFEDGNLVSSTASSFGAFPSTTSYYEYTNLKNTLSNAHFGREWSGQSSKNLVKSERRVQADGREIRHEFSYELDKSGYVRKKIETTLIGNNKDTETTTYTYH